MTDHDVSADVEAIVEDTDLPRRLRERVYETVADRGVEDVETVDDIVRAVEHRYQETRVDPLDPVGTVSAQSIGEPGTQMSIPADEAVVVRRDGRTEVRSVGAFVDDLLDARETRTLDDHEVALAPDDLETLSLSDDERVEWGDVEEVSRHEAPAELLRIDLESGRRIRATKAHSFVTREDNDVVPVAGEDLDPGDWLPVVGEFGVDDPQETLDPRRYLPPGEYWYTAALTDGGATTELPGGEDQAHDRRAALESGEIEENAVYPVQGTVGLPDRLELDEETGFFVGVWLAEGHATDHYVSVSNVNPAVRTRVRAFANRFGLTVDEYENDSGVATGHDVRVNGSVLADLVRAACTEDGRKRVPEFGHGATEEFARGLLAGYFTGDGSVGDAVRASSTSDDLLDGVALLLARFGIHATLCDRDDSRTLRVPKEYVPRLATRVGMVGERGEALDDLAAAVEEDGPDATDQVPNFGDTLRTVADAADVPSRQVNSATERQRIGRARLARLVDRAERATDPEDRPAAVADLRQAVEGDVVWDRVASVETVEPDHEYVYDLSVEGSETFTTAEGVVTHNTMNTFHYAGVAEIDVTQGLPRLIELVDARKEPDTPMMTVHLDGEYATEREKAHEVVWKIESTKVLALGDISTNVADMRVRVDLNEETLRERWPKREDETDADQLERAIEGPGDDDRTGIAERIAYTFDDEITDVERDGTVIEFGPAQPSYRDLLQLVERLRELVFKGIEDVSRVVIRKEETDDDDGDGEFVLYTEGSAFGEVLEIEGVDASRTTCNNIHEIRSELGIEAAREAIIDETMETLEEQGLDDVNVRHLMLVADIMTNRGTIESIGRHGISGSKESVLARAAFEVTVNHLLDAAVHGEVDDLNGVTENVIVGKPIKLGTGDVDLRMRSRTGDTGAD
jgi:DNA-directed RNA polymerase subunit A"